MSTLGERSSATWRKAQRFPLFLVGIGCVGTLFAESLAHVGGFFFVVWWLAACLYALVALPLLGFLFLCETFLDHTDPGWRERP